MPLAISYIFWIFIYLAIILIMRGRLSNISCNNINNEGQALKPTEFDSGETCPTVLLQCLPSSSRRQVQRSQLWRSLGTVTISNLLPKHLVLPCLASPLVKWDRNPQVAKGCQRELAFHAQQPPKRDSDLGVSQCRWCLNHRKALQL